MRKIWLLIIAGLAGLSACNSGSTVKDFIPGSYVSRARSEFSLADDTLIIAPDKNTDNLYLITRRTGYRRITGGKVQGLQHKVKRWTGIWDTQRKVLQVMQTGNALIFQPDQNSLLNGSTEYRKLLVSNN